MRSQEIIEHKLLNILLFWVIYLKKKKDKNQNTWQKRHSVRNATKKKKQAENKTKENEQNTAICDG